MTDIDEDYIREKVATCLAAYPRHKHPAVHTVCNAVSGLLNAIEGFNIRIGNANVERRELWDQGVRARDKLRVELESAKAAHVEQVRINAELQYQHALTKGALERANQRVVERDAQAQAWAQQNVELLRSTGHI